MSTTDEVEKSTSPVLSKGDNEGTRAVGTKERRNVCAYCSLVVCKLPHSGHADETCRWGHHATLKQLFHMERDLLLLGVRVLGIYLLLIPAWQLGE